MARKTLYMETTQIPAAKTIGEIQEFLTEVGAAAIQISNNRETRQPKSLSFMFEVDGVEMPFRLPARIEPVFQNLQKKRSDRTREKQQEADFEQARRVAWRQILRWLEAQFALIDTGMVDPAEVFLAYAQVDIDTTFYQKLKEDNFRKLLPAGNPA